MVEEHDFVYCATDWNGMATEDVPTSRDPQRPLALPDAHRPPCSRGSSNFIYLGRLMIHPTGFASDPRFAGTLDTARLFYDGNSQGGIYGGTLTAVSPDVQRSVLGVPAMNYSTLLQRSIDFGQYAAVLYASYPDEIERPLLFSLIQQLWDRSDPNGYAQHMTADPYPNTPPHTVLMQSAVGDHQVANVAADVEARTIGAKIRAHPVAPGRSNDVTRSTRSRALSFPSCRLGLRAVGRGRGLQLARAHRNTPPVESTATRTRTASRAAPRPRSTRSRTT